MLHVVSTGLNAPTADRCRASVREQTVPHVHHYIEAGEQCPPKGALANRWNVISKLDPTDIVCELDGDDRLSDPDVLARVAADYEDPAVWCTFGQYRVSDGRPGHCAPYLTTDYRREPWKASHLKTYRAGMFHRLDDRDLKVRGEWRTLALDLATMIPIMEMCGPEHVRFCPDVRYVYDFSHSYEFNTTADGLIEEQDAAEEIRAMMPRERLGVPPW